MLINLIGECWEDQKMSSSNTSKLPEQAPHFFTEVVFQFIPDVNYEQIVYLSKIAKAKGKVSQYDPLRDALRKIQWANLAGFEATAVEKEIANEMQGREIAYFPSGMARHAKAMIECVTHTKAALDSIAVFLTEFLHLPATGGQRDLRHKSFRTKLANKDTALGDYIKSIEHWLDDLVKRRDMWIHWSSPRVPLIIGPSQVGILPIAKQLVEYFNLDSSITKEHFWSTNEFIEQTTKPISQLFNTVVKRCIDIELSNYDGEIPQPTAEETKGKISFFPMRPTRDMTIDTIHFKL
jgi:hypothetical protein